MSYFRSKYDSPTVDVLHSLALGEWSLDYSGHSESPTGWFTEPFQISRADLSHGWDTNQIISVIAELDLDYSEQFTTAQELVGIWIVSGDDQGFGYAERFDTLTDAQIAFDAAESEYVRWESACSDCGAATDDDGECTTDASHAGYVER